MMKRLNKLLCALLIAALMLPMAATPAVAAGKYGFINYAALRCSGLSYPVTLVMGDLRFDGKLQNKGHLTDEQLDQLIDQFMREKGYNAKDIQDMVDAVELAKRLDNFTDSDYKRVMEILAKFGGLLPDVGSILSAIINSLGGNYGTVGQDVMEGVAWDAGESFAGGFSANLGSGAEGAHMGKDIADLILLLIEQNQRRQEQLAARYGGSSAKAALDKFYRELADYLDKNNPNKGWHIVFAKARADRRNFTFLGQYGCRQWWTLNMDLKQQGGGYEAGNDPAVGTYTGEFILRVEHDMSDFANDPAKYVGKYLTENFIKEANITVQGVWVFDEPRNLSSGTADITRVINGSATVTVTGKTEPLSGRAKNGYDYTISMDGDGKPSVALSAMQVDFSAETQIADGTGNVTIPVDIISEGEQIILNLLGGTIYVTVGDASVTREMLRYSMPMGWDGKIWLPWESEKTMR